LSRGVKKEFFTNNKHYYSWFTTVISRTKTNDTESFMGYGEKKVLLEKSLDFHGISTKRDKLLIIPAFILIINQEPIMFE